MRDVSSRVFGLIAWGVARGVGCAPAPGALNATTIAASGRADTLIGGGGQDLFYAQVGTDLVLDRTAHEIVFPIPPKKPQTDPNP
jgi:hypothetical protein